MVIYCNLLISILLKLYYMAFLHQNQNNNLLSTRVLFSQQNAFSPLQAEFYYVNTWSNTTFLNYVMKSQGLIGFFISAFQGLMARFTTVSLWFDVQKFNYNDLTLAMEKYHLRSTFFGTSLSVRVLQSFVEYVGVGLPVINIGHTHELSLPAADTFSNVVFEKDSAYPLFSPAAHFLRENKTMFSAYSHPFHIVDPSPWPFCTSICLWYLTFTTVAFFHNYLYSALNIIFGLVYTCISLAFWWRDVIRESTYEFKHTPYVRRGLLNGVLLFIISEVMFFFGFFWAFFHSSLAPSHYIGGVWPPLLIDTISPWQLPLVNTMCLLLSGVSLTIAHRQLNGLPYYNQTVSSQWPLVRRLILWMQVTVALGVFFLGCQAVEYYLSPFTFQDTVFGGTFYILTGLHGLHVLVGATFLLVCLWRASRLHFTMWKQVGFKAAVWYWHFVDVVWIFLFLVVYIWSGSSVN